MHEKVSTAGAGAHETRAAWGMVIVFFVFYNLSFIDRQLLNFLVDPIRATLGISDFEFSLAQGAAFVVLYVLLGFPIGWLVDRGPRRPVIFCGVWIWSAGIVLCGLAGRFWHFVLGRVGLGAGEATLAPAAYSMLSDVFPPNRLALPMSIMVTGASTGTVLASVWAGVAMEIVPAEGITLPLLGTLEPWQAAFLALGPVGLVMAPLVFLFREPARKQTVTLADQLAGEEPSIRAIVREEPWFYAGHFLGFGFLSMGGWAITAWAPTFIIRHYDWSVQDTAFGLGPMLLVAGVLGTVSMGYLVDRWFSAGKRDAHVVFFAVAALLEALAVALTVTASSGFWAIVMLSPVIFLTNFSGIAAAALQIMTPPRARGRFSAAYIFTYTVMGMGLGPLSVAFMTDFVFGDEKQIGMSILVACTVCFTLSSIFLLCAGPAMRRKLATGSMEAQ